MRLKYFIITELNGKEIKKKRISISKYWAIRIKTLSRFKTLFDYWASEELYRMMKIMEDKK